MKTEAPVFTRLGPFSNFLVSAGAALSLNATAIMIMEGLSRYFLNVSYFWAEESVRFLMIWAFSLTLGIAGFRQLHIRTELLVQKLPASVQRVCWLIACATGIAFSVILVYSSIPQTVRYFTMGVVSESNMELPMWLLYLSMPVAGLGLLWYYLNAAAFAWRGSDPFFSAPTEEAGGGGPASGSISNNPLL